MTGQGMSVTNVPFQLHYKLTSIILVVFSSVLVFYHIFGPGPITCNGASWLPTDYFRSFCLDSLSSTLRYDIVLPGSKSTSAISISEKQEDRIYQGFYPYVWLFFLWQAVNFCVPLVVWKAIEGGKTKRIAEVLGNPNLEDRVSNLKRISGYVSDNFRTNDGYVIGFFVCELLNFINALVQMHSLNWFVRGQLEVNDNQTTVVASVADLFPSTIMCQFQRDGPSGLPQRIDGPCTLPLNFLHHKMFVFLSIWFGILIAISSLVLLYRLAWLCSSRLRKALLLKHYRRASSQFLLDANVDKFRFGDYFFMHVILEKTHPIHLQDFLSFVHGHKVDSIGGEPMSLKSDFIEVR